MVTAATSLTQSGLRDWLIQRLTAFILGVYTIFLLVFLIAHNPLQFADWHDLFANNFMRAFTFLALLSLVYHTWIGIWTVFTDYVKVKWLRLLLQVLVVISLLGYLVWGIEIVWGL